MGELERDRSASCQQRECDTQHDELGHRDPHQSCPSAVMKGESAGRCVLRHTASENRLRLDRPRRREAARGHSAHT
jgi:hypothetical protein